MDARQLTVFTADVQAQMQLIHRVAALLDLRAEGLQREDAARLESVAARLDDWRIDRMATSPKVRT